MGELLEVGAADTRMTVDEGIPGVRFRNVVETVGDVGSVEFATQLPVAKARIIRREARVTLSRYSHSIVRSIW